MNDSGHLTGEISGDLLFQLAVDQPVQADVGSLAMNPNLATLQVGASQQCRLSFPNDLHIARRLLRSLNFQFVYHPNDADNAQRELFRLHLFSQTSDLSRERDDTFTDVNFNAVGVGENNRVGRERTLNRGTD